MRALKPSELTAILPELQRQIAIEQYNELRNHWAFLAAVITNGLKGIAGMFSKRKPKPVSPDDFIDKEAKKMLQQLLVQEQKPVQEPEQKDWERHIKDAMAKGLKGPWKGGGKVC